MKNICSVNFRTIITTILIVVISCIGSYISYFYGHSCCSTDNIQPTKEPVIVQEKKATSKYYHIFYRKIQDWKYGRIDVGKYDFDNISEGDTLYLTFEKTE